MAATKAALLAGAILALAQGVRAAPDATKAFERPEYLAIKKQLVRGWGTWDSRDALAQVHLPDGFSVGLAFREIGTKDVYAKPRLAAYQDGSKFRAEAHALDGSYSEAEITWKGSRMLVQSATEGDDLVILVTPIGSGARPLELVVTGEILWGRPGKVSPESGGLLASLPGSERRVFVTGQIASRSPDAAAALSEELTGRIGVSTGRVRTLEEIWRIVGTRRKELQDKAAKHGALAGAYDAIRASIGWSTIYDPEFDRVVTVVSREWDKWFGGYVLFGWDNFFIPYACSLFDRNLTYANFAEHMRGLTPGGFIPNVDETGGRRSWDRSQPPVGSLMLKEIFKRFGDRWILEASFDDLLSWNRWWARNRMNGKLLGWGSDLTGNPMNEKDAHTAVAAAWESGMDDSPMFEGVPFNPQTGRLQIQDVGLNSLYVADCQTLAEIADLLGRKVEAAELRLRAEQFRREIDSLWDPAAGLYLNRRSDTGEFSQRVSPTMFYPLIGRIPTLDRATEMVDQHLMNPTEFGGEYVIPSISRQDPTFPKQHYWKGAVWPPLNFLVYMGLRNYDLPQARRQLAKKSMAIFMGEWRRKGFISENYSSLTGTGDDPHLTSTPFYTWGALMGMMGFIEDGQMPAPEAALAPPVPPAGRGD